MKVLILGGTAEARALAATLVALGMGVTTSLAGRVMAPRLPAGGVRIGGFGGAAGLAAYAGGFDTVVDATHPFAAQISAHAAEVRPFVPLLRLARPGWSRSSGAAGWVWVHEHAEAAVRAVELGERPFLTVGRQALASFIDQLETRAVLVRVVDEPDVELPPTWVLRRDRGPYELRDELALMQRHDVDLLVTKDSGGSHTWPTMQAAESLGVPVVVWRPPPPAGLETVSDLDDAVRWVRSQPARPGPPARPVGELG